MSATSPDKKLSQSESKSASAQSHEQGAEVPQTVMELDTSFLPEDNVPLLQLKPELQAVSQLEEGDHILVNPLESTGHTFCARVECLQPLTVQYYRPNKPDKVKCGWVANDITHPCDRSDVSHIIEPPVLLDPSRK